MISFPSTLTFFERSHGETEKVEGDMSKTHTWRWKVEERSHFAFMEHVLLAVFMSINSTIPAFKPLSNETPQLHNNKDIRP